MTLARKDIESAFWSLLYLVDLKMSNRSTIIIMHGENFTYCKSVSSLESTALKYSLLSRFLQMQYENRMCGHFSKVATQRFKCSFLHDCDAGHHDYREYIPAHMQHDRCQQGLVAHGYVAQAKTKQAYR